LQGIMFAYGRNIYSLSRAGYYPKMLSLTGSRKTPKPQNPKTPISEDRGCELMSLGSCCWGPALGVCAASKAVEDKEADEYVHPVLAEERLILFHLLLLLLLALHLAARRVVLELHEYRPRALSQSLHRGLGIECLVLLSRHQATLLGALLQGGEEVGVLNVEREGAQGTLGVRIESESVVVAIAGVVASWD